MCILERQPIYCSFQKATSTDIVRFILQVRSINISQRQMCVLQTNWYGFIYVLGEIVTDIVLHRNFSLWTVFVYTRIPALMGSSRLQTSRDCVGRCRWGVFLTYGCWWIPTTSNTGRTRTTGQSPVIPSTGLQSHFQSFLSHFWKRSP